jgi:hypothetical protein
MTYSVRTRTIHKIRTDRLVTARLPSAFRRFAWLGAAALAVWGFAPRPVFAVVVEGYSATVNDRFTSGFPTNPVPNTSGSFVGAAYDWSGVGWSAADATKGFGFITPQHYLVARHYGGASTITLRGADGSLRSATQASVANTGYGAVFQNETLGDLSIGRLTAPMPAAWQTAAYSVLDLNATSSSNSSYNNQPLLVYGRGANGLSSPRVGAATVNGTVLSGSNSYVTSSVTGSTSVKLEVGDSGSPIFIPWTNPAGGTELTILGNNAAVDSTNNYYNYLANSAVMGAINGLITPDGYALRVRGNINATWTGAANSSISVNGNWSGGTRTDEYVQFDASGSVPTSVNMNAVTTLRGLYFTSGTAATQGFTVSGGNTLTIGRGGLTNYSPLRQTFSASLTLGDHQYWDVGAGGVTAAAINTNGKLLEIAGSGTARITGAVSGTGGLALSGHRLELTGSSSYTGGTWGHAGTLVVNGTIATSSGVALAAGAALGGTGRVSAISGAGMVGPGNSPGILTATSVDPSGGLDFAFEFGQTGAPIWATGTASGNDVLRLTAGTPITSAMTMSNAINVYLGVTSLALNDTFQGGFFTDASADFLTSIQNAAYTYYVLGNGAGTATTYNGQGYYLLDTSFWPAFEEVLVSTVTVPSANFAGGTVTDGRTMQLTIVPEPAALGLAILGAALAAAVRRK